MAEKDPGLLETIRELRSRDPFDPFRIVMSSGEKYSIEDPDNLVIGETRLFYCVPRSEHVIYMRMNQIVSIEQFFSKAVRRRRKSA